MGPASSDRRRAGEAGQAIVWVAVMLPLFMSVIGLTLDGGVVFAAKKDLQNVADTAARAGATQLDEARYRQSATVTLVPAKARQTAAEAVSKQAPGVAAAISADDRQVVVEVARAAPTAFLRILRIDSVRIVAVGRAEVRRGIEYGER